MRKAVPGNRERARTYRHRAEELRTKIDRWSDSMARRGLEYVACQYDILAAKLEQLPDDPLRAENVMFGLPVRVSERALGRNSVARAEGDFTPGDC